MNATDEVGILYTDLEQMHKALSALYNYLWAQDATKAYSALRSKVQESPLTAEVKRQRDKVFGYMHEAQIAADADEEEVDNG